MHQLYSKIILLLLHTNSKINAQMLFRSQFHSKASRNRNKTLQLMRFIAQFSFYKTQL